MGEGGEDVGVSGGADVVKVKRMEWRKGGGGCRCWGSSVVLT